MTAVSVQDVSKQYGTQLVLDRVSLQISPGETVGLVGANGCGKTTLLRIIARREQPDLGSVAYGKKLEIGYLTQDPLLDPASTVHDEVLAAFADILELERKMHIVSEQMGDPGGANQLSELMKQYDRLNEQFIAAGGHTFETRLKEILGGLGFAPSEFSAPIAILSGGQKCRVGLARLLLEDPTMLLLDEPTNHLDIDAVRWLEKFLADHQGGAVIVSHDRYLLDRLCDRIVELERRKVTSYPGNYSNYAATKARTQLTLERQFEKDREFIQKEQAYIAKHLAGQRTRQAQGRRKRLERQLEAGDFVTEVAAKHRSARISFENTKMTQRDRSQTALRCDDLSMAYGEKTLFSNLNLQVRAGDRLGITGPNGTGKTTLLKIITADVKPLSGMVELLPHLSVGNYSQQPEPVVSGRNVLEEYRTVSDDLSEAEARNVLAAYRFTGDDVFKPLTALSGGEMSRLRLAKLIRRNPDLLILDEPTNHLDIPSREALENALQAFDGTIIAVSHDRYFLDRVVDRLLVMRPGQYTTFAGNYSQYIEEQEQQQSQRKQKPAREGTTSSRRQARKSTPARSEFDSMNVEEIEAIVIKRETELARLQERFGDPEICRDPETLAELKEEAEEMERLLAEADAAWQERTEYQ